MIESELPSLESRQHLLRRFLQIRSATAPSLSPTGSHLAFLTDLTGSYQVWTTDLQGAWPEQRTFGAERAQFVAHSPDRRHLAYGTDHGGNERTQIHLLDLETGDDRDLSQNPAAFHTFGAFSPDGSHIAFASNRREPAFFDAYIMATDAEGGSEPRLLKKGESYYLPIAFSPDGGRVILWELLGSFANHLHEVELSTGNSRRLTADGMWRYNKVTYAADGKSIVLISDYERDFLAIARMDLESLDISWLYAPEWDVEHFTLSDDHALGAIIVNEDAISRLYIHDLSKGIEAGLTTKPTPVPLPEGRITALDFGADGDALAVAMTAPQHNGNIWMIEGLRGEAKAPRQVTFSSASGFDTSTFPTPTQVRYPTFDGRDIPGILYVPEHSEAEIGTLPVIVYVHGGPESQSRVGFSSIIPYFVSQGFGFFLPNVRGSTGYGRHYSDLDNTTKRLDSVKDLEAAAKWLKGQGLFHPDKISVMGGSYGGYMTLAALSMFPEHWAAGVDVVGIANLRTFIANTGAYRRRWRILEYGDPEVIGDIMDTLSPINHVHKIRAPLMVIHGANDPRVPQSEADQIVEAVKARGGVVEYLLYPDEGHGVAKLHNRIHCYSRVAEFLHKHLMEG